MFALCVILLLQLAPQDEAGKMWRGGNSMPNGKKPVAARSSPSTQETEAPPAADLNLLGKADTKSGEGKRNENVAFNLIDNNAQKEAQTRTGITATIYPEWLIQKNYFSTQYGNPPVGGVQVMPRKAGAFHGEGWYLHSNSVTQARSFFQVGGVEPARQNRYGFTAAIPLPHLWMFSLDGSQAKIRGQVNGNVLVPRLDERTPLATDPAVARTVQRFLDAFPKLAPNRTDINPRALNLNSPQVVDTDTALIRLDGPLAKGDRLAAQFRFTGQDVLPHQFVQGQNPVTTTKDHSTRLT